MDFRYSRHYSAKSSNNLLPPKSVNKYNSTYAAFRQWQTHHNVTSLNENVLLVYFDHLADKFAPSTLWANYSMPKSTIQTKHNVDIGKYSNLTTFLKRKSNGLKSKKSPVFSAQNLRKFFTDAPDEQYLLYKVIGQLFKKIKKFNYIIVHFLFFLLSISGFSSIWNLWCLSKWRNHKCPT